MAFTALTCLNHTIHLLLNSSHVSTSLLTSCPEIKSVQDVVTSLQELLRHGNERVMDDFDGKAQEAAYRLQDVMEEILIGGHGSDSSAGITVVKQEINTFTQKAKMFEEHYTMLLQQLSNDEEEEGDDVLPRTDLDSITSRMIGLEEQFVNIRNKLLNVSPKSRPLLIFSIVGMTGIGKTALAKRIYQDLLVEERFQISAFVSIGPKYDFKHILKSILAQIMSPLEVDKINSEEVLVQYMKRHLEGKRYLIVLDDVWDRNIVKKFIGRCIVNANNGSRVLMTSRIHDVTIDLRHVVLVFKIRFLNEEEGWYLFLEKVFGNRSCPRELWKVGRKIVENCQGLPLTIIAMAELLSKAEKTVEYWESVAENANPLSIGIDDQTQMTPRLLLSYKYLRQDLKPCFLYMAVFLRNYEIRVSQLINLWRAEGFLGPNVVAMDYLKELVSNSVVLVCEQNLSGKMTTCKLHSTYWHVCVSEARKRMLFHVMNTYFGSFAPSIKAQRRLSVQNHVLFGLKDVCESMASVTNAHSLLCTGLHHKYPIPIRFCLKLLRVLDAVTIHFYEFPIEVFKLNLLRYLAFTCNDKLPTSISRLSNLQFLIVSRCFSIRSSKTWSYLPMEIWDMKELRHLQVTGSDLPDPASSSLLPNLVALLDVSPRSCTSQVLKSIPNLKKLGVQVDLASYTTDSLHISEQVVCTLQLQSLKFIITNLYNTTLQVVPLPFFATMLQDSLRELSLSGLRYPWECIGTIGELPYLEVLKLQCDAFQGRTWISRSKSFKKLRALLLEDIDLVYWEAEHRCFQRLESLTVKHCYRLKYVPLEATNTQFLRRIELVDVNPSTVFSLKGMLRLRGPRLNQSLQVHVHTSWNKTTQAMSAALAVNDLKLQG